MSNTRIINTIVYIVCVYICFQVSQIIELYSELFMIWRSQSNITTQGLSQCLVLSRSRDFRHVRCYRDLWTFTMFGCYHEFFPAWSVLSLSRDFQHVLCYGEQETFSMFCVMATRDRCSIQ